MRYPGFISGSYELQSPLADMERTVNWYPEQIASPAVPWGAALFPTPGQDEFLTVGTVNTRALFAMNDRVHAVVGGALYELFAGATSTSRGTMLQDPNPASIASNGDAGGELLIASGTNGYLLNLSTSAFSTVLTGDCTMVGMLDGYFLAFNTATSKFRISDLNDGTTWDATQYAQRSIAPDPWRAMVVDGSRQIWLIGEQTGEVWYDSGASPFPFEPVPGAVFGYRPQTGPGLWWGRRGWCLSASARMRSKRRLPATCGPPRLPMPRRSCMRWRGIPSMSCRFPRPMRPGRST